jgi:hypothetical protein
MASQEWAVAWADPVAVAAFKYFAEKAETPNDEPPEREAFLCAQVLASSSGKTAKS